MVSIHVKRTHREYTRQEILTIKSCQLSVSCLSIVVGAVGITLWLRMAYLRRVLFRLRVFFLLILCDFIRSLLTVILATKTLHIYSNVEGGFCGVFQYLFSTISIFSDLLITVLAIHFLLVIFYPSTIKRYVVKVPSIRALSKNVYLILTFRRSIFKKGLRYNDPPEREIVYDGGLYSYRHFILIVIFLLGAGLPGLASVNGQDSTDQGLCNLPIEPAWKRIVIVYGFKYFNTVLIILAYLAISIYMSFSLYKINKQRNEVFNRWPQQTGEQVDFPGELQRELMDLTAPDDAKRQRSIIKELNTLALYPLGYLFVWTVPLIAQIWNYVANRHGVSRPFGLDIIVVIAAPLSCTVITVIFLACEKPWRMTEKRVKGQANGSEHCLFHDVVGVNSSQEETTQTDAVEEPNELKSVKIHHASNGASLNQPLWKGAGSSLPKPLSLTTLRDNVSELGGYSENGHHDTVNCDHESSSCHQRDDQSTMSFNEFLRAGYL